MARLCLNMIVKNEARIIERCLRSVAPYVDRYVVCDTGSSDGTPARIREVMAAYGVPGEIHHIPFHTFEQARNAALEHARLACDPDEYLLLTDADMELVVEDLDFRDRLTHPLYAVRQESGLSYYNVRLVRAGLDARYVGVTHEYLAAPVDQQRFEGVWFLDHANGGNRGEKLDRDIRLLTADLERNPGDPRSLFYLAQSLKDAGRPAEALPVYRRRIAAGGWEEEVWYARYMVAECLRRLGEHDAFVAACWAAYDARPARAEPLRLLATHYRETGQHDACLAVCELGETIPYPRDALFVEPDVYGLAFAWEKSICGFYSKLPRRRDAGREACFDLTTAPAAGPDRRWRALNNATYYARPAAELFPGTVFARLEPELEAGWSPSNPSIAIDGGRRWCVVRTVNYRVRPDGGYDIHDPVGTVRTRNAVAELDAAFRIAAWTWIDEAADPGPVYPSQVAGFEDLRLVFLDGAPWGLATARDRQPEMLNRMALMELDDAWRLRRLSVLSSPEPHLPQKNWMPFARDGALHVVYRMEPLTILRIDPATLQPATVSTTTLPHLDLSALRGGSPLVPWGDGWIAAVHETAVAAGQGRRYLHRFVTFDRHLGFERMTEPFVFRQTGVEFCAGLAYDAERDALVASFGRDDGEAWLAELPRAGVERRLTRG